MPLKSRVIFDMTSADPDGKALNLSAPSHAMIHDEYPAQIEAFRNLRIVSGLNYTPTARTAARGPNFAPVR